MQVVASCDSTGVTVINEDAINLDEGLVEVAYINISEDMMLDEIEGIETSTVDDEGTRQSWEFETLEIDEDETSLESEGFDQQQHTAEPADEEQIAVTSDFLAGKISFQDFITRVEGEGDGQTKTEDFSDDDDDVTDSKQDDDPDYAPEPRGTSKKGKSLKAKPNVVESTIFPTVEGGSTPIRSSVKPTSPKKASTKPKKAGPRVLKRLPANLLGIINNELQKSLSKPELTLFYSSINGGGEFAVGSKRKGRRNQFMHGSYPTGTESTNIL